MGNLLRESGEREMEIYDHLSRSWILFRLRGPETGKKVGHGIGRRKLEGGLQISRHPESVTCIMHLVLGSELVTDPDEEVSSFLLYIRQR